MVHFIRNKNNQTIIECDVYNNDLSTSTNIENYSNKLIDLLESNEHTQFIKDFSDLSQIRGLWWEIEKFDESWKTINKFVESHFKKVAEKYKLNYITD